MICGLLLAAAADASYYLGGASSYLGTSNPNPFGFIATGGFKHREDVNPRCYNGCPEDSPCFNPWTGLCNHKLCTTPSTDKDPEDGRDFTKPGGPKADDDFAAAAAHEPVCTCSGNTVLTSRLSVHNPIILWVGFGLLFLPGAWFVVNGGIHRKGAAQVARRSEAFLAGATCLVSALAYLAMALGVGYTRRCDGRQVFWARQVDWLFTYPLVLYQVLTFSGTAVSLTNIAIGVEIIVMLAMLGASTVTQELRWNFWLFGMFCMLPVIWILATAPYMYTPTRDLYTHGHLMEDDEEESERRLAAARARGLKPAQLAKRSRLMTHDAAGDDEELDHPSLSSAPSRSPDAEVVNSWGKKVGGLMNKVKDAQSQVEGVLDDIDSVLDVVPKSWRPFVGISEAEQAMDEAEKWVHELATEVKTVLHVAEDTLESLASWLEVGWEKWEGMGKLQRKAIKKVLKQFVKTKLRPVLAAFKIKVKEWAAELEQFVEDLIEDLLKKIGEWLIELIKEEVKDVLKELFDRVKKYIIDRLQEFLKPILAWIAGVLLTILVDVLRLLVDILLRPHGVVVENKTYSAIVWLTITCWILQPAIWLFGDGTGFLSVQAETYLYFALDILLRVGVSSLIYYAGDWVPGGGSSDSGGCGDGGCCPGLLSAAETAADRAARNGRSSDKVAVWQGAGISSPASPGQSMI